MTKAWLAIPVAFAVTAILIHVFRGPAIRLGLVDIPGGRKEHVGEVPLIGGVAMFLGFASATLLLEQSLTQYRPLYAGMSLLLVAGILDDLHDLSARAKFALQLVAAFFVVAWGGLKVSYLGNLFGLGPIHLGILSTPFTIICVVGLVNAVNMADGSDGLAGGIVFVMLLWLIAATLLAGLPLPIMPLLLAGSVLAFLLFNFPHAKRRHASIFMGDSGSMILGFATAWFAIQLMSNSDGRIPPITIAAILMLPVSDTVILIARRIYKGQSPMAADREHLHHIFERAGFSRPQTVYTLISTAGLTGAIGIIGWKTALPDGFVSLLLITFFVLHLFFVLHAWRMMRVLRRMHGS